MIIKKRTILLLLLMRYFCVFSFGLAQASSIAFRYNAYKNNKASQNNARFSINVSPITSFYRYNRPVQKSITNYEIKHVLNEVCQQEQTLIQQQPLQEKKIEHVALASDQKSAISEIITCIESSEELKVIAQVKKHYDHERKQLDFLLDQIALRNIPVGLSKTYDNPVFLVGLGKQYLNQAEAAIVHGNSEFEQRYIKRTRAIIQAIEKPDHVFYARQGIDQLKTLTHFRSLYDDHDPYKDLFSKCYGNAIHQQLHEELVSSVRYASHLSAYYADDPYLTSNAVFLYEGAAAAKKQNNPEVAFHLSDFCYHLTQATKNVVNGIKSHSSLMGNYLQGKIDGFVMQVEFWKNLSAHPSDTLYNDILVPLGLATLALSHALATVTGAFYEDFDEVVPKAELENRRRMQQELKQKIAQATKNVTTDDVAYFWGILNAPDPLGVALSSIKLIGSRAKAFVKAVDKQAKLKLALIKTSQLTPEATRALEPIRVVTQETAQLVEVFNQNDRVVAIMNALKNDVLFIKQEGSIIETTRKVCDKVKKIEAKPHWRSLMLEPGSEEVIFKGFLEGLVGIAAEEKGKIPGPLKRDPTKAAEFIDCLGRAWDVKTPPSFASNGKRVFDLQEVLTSIKKELNSGEYIILSMIRLDQKDALTLVETLKTVLSPGEIKKIITVFRNDLF